VVRERREPGSWLPLFELLIKLRDAYRSEVATLLRENRALRSSLAEARREARRLSRMRTFFSPQVADMILSRRDSELLAAERREVTVVFIDLRGFTMFTQTSDPEEVGRVLHEFHAEVGRRAHAVQGTIERFTGDGLMVFFNAPHAVVNGPEAAVRLALHVRARFHELAKAWWARGYDLNLGIGISHGFATAGVIGFEGRRDYAVIGTVTNLAARLCSEAQASQILTGRSLIGALGSRLENDFVGDLVLKGFVKPVAAFSIRGLRGAVTSGTAGSDDRCGRD
jgi:class 3 adenylate cyclase